MFTDEPTRHRTRSWVLVLAVLVWICVPNEGQADGPPGQPLETGADVALFRARAVGNSIVAIAAIDSMSYMDWREGVGSGMPHLRLHLDVKKVLYGQLSPDTIVISENVAVCHHGELIMVETTTGSFWPYVGDLVLFGASWLPHDGKDVWHVTEMRLISAYGGLGARMYKTQIRLLRVRVDCTGGEDRGMTNCIPRTLTDSGALDDVLRDFSLRQ